MRGRRRARVKRRVVSMRASKCVTKAVRRRSKAWSVCSDSARAKARRSSCSASARKPQPRSKRSPRIDCVKRTAKSKKSRHVKARRRRKRRACRRRAARAEHACGGLRGAGHRGRQAGALGRRGHRSARTGQRHVGGGKPSARPGDCYRRRRTRTTVRDASQRGAVARRGFSRCIACCSKIRRCSTPRAI